LAIKYYVNDLKIISHESLEDGRPAGGVPGGVVHARVVEREHLPVEGGQRDELLPVGDQL
jgi:hypothetical protein